MPDELRVDGGATVYRVYDIGYAVSLDRAAHLLGDTLRGQARPRRIEARAIQIRNPPVDVALGSREVRVAGVERTAGISARLFDFGVATIHVDLIAPTDLTWIE